MRDSNIEYTELGEVSSKARFIVTYEHAEQHYSPFMQRFVFVNENETHLIEEAINCVYHCLLDGMMDARVVEYELYQICLLSSENFFDQEYIEDNFPGVDYEEALNEFVTFLHALSRDAYTSIIGWLSEFKSYEDYCSFAFTIVNEVRWGNQLPELDEWVVVCCEY